MELFRRPVMCMIKLLYLLLYLLNIQEEMKQGAWDCQSLYRGVCLVFSLNHECVRLSNHFNAGVRHVLRLLHRRTTLVMKMLIIPIPHVLARNGQPLELQLRTLHVKKSQMSCLMLPSRKLFMPVSVLCWWHNGMWTSGRWTGYTSG